MYSMVSTEMRVANAFTGAHLAGGDHPFSTGSLPLGYGHTAQGGPGVGSRSERGGAPCWWRGDETAGPGSLPSLAYPPVAHTQPPPCRTHAGRVCNVIGREGGREGGMVLHTRPPHMSAVCTLTGRREVWHHRYATPSMPDTCKQCVYSNRQVRMVPQPCSAGCLCHPFDSLKLRNVSLPPGSGHTMQRDPRGRQLIRGAWVAPSVQAVTPGIQ